MRHRANGRLKGGETPLRCVRRPIIKRCVPLGLTLIRLQWPRGARNANGRCGPPLCSPIAAGSHGRAMQSAPCRVAATPITHCASIGYSAAFVSDRSPPLNHTVAHTFTLHTHIYTHTLPRCPQQPPSIFVRSHSTHSHYCRRRTPPHRLAADEADAFTYSHAQFEQFEKRCPHRPSTYDSISSAGRRRRSRRLFRKQCSRRCFEVCVADGRASTARMT